MQSADPYRAPVSHVADAPSSDVSRINIWSPKGRLGRVRYIGYSIGLAFVIQFFAGYLSAMAGQGPGDVIMLIGTAGALVVHALLSVQRAHDFNSNGWLAILAFVPLFNFVFWIVPGTDGDNRFGLKTPPNSVASVVLAGIFPFILIVGIVAAIAIPAYHRHEYPAPTIQTE